MKERVMKFIDMHCDTLMIAFIHKQHDIYEMPGTMLDVRRMKQGEALAQFFAIFMPPPGAEKHFGFSEPISDDEYINTLLNIFQNTVTKHNDCIAAACNCNDVMINEKKGKMSGILTLEDGRAVDGSLEKLKEYYDKGIRLISLTWNHENCFGFPNSKKPEIMGKGLTGFGKEAVQYMNHLGMLIDVSHLSDGGFYDVAQISEKPFVASHSNCRALSPHQRNLTDDMIKVIAEKGGVAGINFGPEFLNEDIEVKDSTLELLSKHIQRMITIGGADCVSIGSDFDGIKGNMEIADTGKMQLLFDRLHKDNLSDDAIEKIAYKNALRVMKEVLI